MAPIERSSVDPKLMADGIEGILDVYEVRAKGARREIANDLAAHFIATHESIVEGGIERLRGLIADYLNARSTFDLSSGEERHDAADLLIAAERALRNG